MKGQLIFEFVTAVIFFLGMVFYVINYMGTEASGISTNFQNHLMENMAVRVSEMIVRGEGVWSGGNPKVIGLAKEWPVLDKTKISNLNTYCKNNYQELLEKLEVKPYRVRIEINDSNGYVLECGKIIKNATRVGITRFAVSEDNDILRVGVWIW